MPNVVVILGGYLVRGADLPPAENAGLAIEGTRILAVDHNANLLAGYPDAELVDRRNDILIPGFVNAHHHMYGVLSHGIYLTDPPRDLWPFLTDFWWPFVEDALNHDNIRAATDWACYEMVNNGITTFYDCLEGTLAIPGALEVEAEVVQRWGLRGHLSFEATERRSKENGQLGLQENAGFIRQQNRSDALVRGLMCFHATFTCSRQLVEQAVGLAKDLGTRVHMHVSEGNYEPEWCLRTYGRRTLEVYHSWSVLGPHTLASQCVQISPAERQILAETGAHVAHMPLSNCEVGAGFAPMPELMAQGVTVGLGTDGYVNDPFQVMRAAMLIPKSRLLDAGVTDARMALKMATENGAVALGHDDVGKLEAGFSADIVVVRGDLPTRITPDNLFDQLVLWRNVQDVSDVLVAGRWLKRDGQVLGADREALRIRCREAALEIR